MIRWGLNIVIDGGRWDRLDDRDKERKSRDANEATDGGDRRNGAGRGNYEGWTRTEQKSSNPENGRDVRNFSWRDGGRDGGREAPRERERDRDGHDRFKREWNNRNNRYDNNQPEEEPEWMMDEPENHEEKVAKTQDDFQKWKEQQKQMAANKNGISEEKEEPTQPVQPKMPTQPSKSTGFLPTLGNAFGTFGEPQIEEADDVLRPTTSKKASRFQTLFKKEDTSEPLPGLLAGLGNEPERPIPNDNASTEDAQGFQRILMMLGNKGLTPKPLDDSNLPQEHPLFSGESNRSPQERTGAERQRDSAGFIDDLLARQMASQERNRVQQLSRDMEQLNVRQQAPSDTSRVSERNDVSQSRRDNLPHISSELSTVTSPQNAGLDPNKAFLLNLMKDRMSEPPRPQEHTEFSQMKTGMMQPQQTVQPKQRQTPSAPPGIDLKQRRPIPDHEMSSGRRGQQPPPGFFDQDSHIDVPMALPGLQRRNTAESGPSGPLGRSAGPPQASNLGIPSLRMNETMMMHNGNHMVVDNRMMTGPPPGLMPNSGPQGRAPPGINGIGGPLSNNAMRGNLPQMGPPGYPPPGMQMNMHNMPPGSHVPNHFQMGPLQHQHQNHLSYPQPHFSGGPPPGMHPMGGFFPPGGRGFPPGFENGGAPINRGYQGQ